MKTIFVVYACDAWETHTSMKKEGNFSKLSGALGNIYHNEQHYKSAGDKIVIKEEGLDKNFNAKLCVIETSSFEVHSFGGFLANQTTNKFEELRKIAKENKI